jgi:hypothetical protein
MNFQGKLPRENRGCRAQKLVPNGFAHRLWEKQDALGRVVT